MSRKIKKAASPQGKSQPVHLPEELFQWPDYRRPAPAEFMAKPPVLDAHLVEEIAKHQLNGEQQVLMATRFERWAAQLRGVVFHQQNLN